MSDPPSSTDLIRADIARLSDELDRRVDEHERVALSVDPANGIAARNLAAVYRLLLETGAAELGGLPAEEMRARLAVIAATLTRCVAGRELPWIGGPQGNRSRGARLIGA